MVHTAFTRFSQFFKRHEARIPLYVSLLIAVFSINLAIQYNTFADDSTERIAETTFFGNLEDDGKGCGVYTVLNMAIDIFSIGVGIVAVVGIMIVGIQYLTAKDNEQQVSKSKRRMIEIVIGLVAYAVLFVAFQWLLPGGSLNTTKCNTVDDATLAEMKAAEQAAKQASRNQTSTTTPQSDTTGGKGGTASNPIAASGNSAPVCTNCTWGERIAQTAELLAWPYGTPKKTWHHNYSEPTGFKKWSDLKKARPTEAFMKAYDTVRPNHKLKTWGGIGADCARFVIVVALYSGHEPKWENWTLFDTHFNNHKDRWKVFNKNSTTPQRGDICYKNYSGGFHTRIYLGNGLIAEANHHGKSFGHIAKGNCNGYKIARSKR